ncbi:axonemal dynein light intermediate polypeptide 1 [Gouania willdenowi]|uniref:axonemal dynein light intermediate polypeptide 1 n=1 Tax=Gouania willdenowi TaxID=441366 RepID=UPI0010568676|nr:axonemal dynein light intermediate polypeptide 1 [Gouania willdenowi]
MSRPEESLMKYDNLVLISNDTDSKGRALRVSMQQVSSSRPVPPPPKPKSPSNKTVQQKNDDILNCIFPPRKWKEGNQLCVQQVSSVPCTRLDVVSLENSLDTKLQQKQARATGICHVRRELYTQCFDELIRQVAVSCAERGLLLSRVKNEIQMTIGAYHTLYESAVTFGLRKALQAHQDKTDMEQKLSDLEDEIKDLKEQLEEQKAKCKSLEKSEAEKRQQEEMKHLEEIQYLKKANQQLKALLEAFMKSNK